MEGAAWELGLEHSRGLEKGDPLAEQHCGHAQLFMSQPVALIQNGVEVSELNPWTKETKSYGDTCTPMENAGVFQGLNHSLGFTCVWLLPPLPLPQQQFPDPGSPFPPHPRAPYNVRQKSVDGDEEDAPFSPDEHKKR